MPVQQAPASEENFAQLLEESLGQTKRFEGSVVKGTVLSVDNDIVLIDVGLKSEGRVPLKEFATPGQETEVNPGDAIDVFVERYEDKDGMVILSREKARREEAWTELEKAFKGTERGQRGHLRAASRAASSSIWRAPWPSCPEARWTSGPCATSGP